MIALLKCAVTRESEVHRVNLAEKSAATETADHALRADETQAILRIDGGIAAAVTAGQNIQRVVALVDSSTMTMIGTEKQSILGMVIVEEDVEVLASDMTTEVTTEVADIDRIEVVAVEPPEILEVIIVRSRRCM